MFDICKSCGKKQYIVNKKHLLCTICNQEKIHKKPYIEIIKEKQQRYKQNQVKRSLKMIDEMDLTYEKVFNQASKPLCCAECGRKLNQNLRENGKIIDRFRFSHILPKSKYPEFKYDTRNFFILCFKCHQKWEFGGDKEKIAMKIWFPSIEKIKQLKTEIYKS